MFNKVVLIGRLTQDPDMRYTPAGIPVARFTLAVDRPFKKQDGTRDTDFIDIVAWRQRAEFASNYLGKGRQILVEGRLQVRSFVGQDGVRRRVAEVQAENFTFVGPPSGERAAAAEAEELPPAPSESDVPEDPGEFGGPPEKGQSGQRNDPLSHC
jgi:single-strand DNA-binding protein